MSSSSVQVFAKEYFNSLNSIAERISSDVASTIAAYEDLWHTLSNKDKNQVVDETIIHPEAVLKYSFHPQDQPEVEYYSRLHLETGYKYVIDDEGCKGSNLAWRDEHSAPFSWMTRSQLNLSVFCDNEMMSVVQTAPVTVQSRTKLTPSKKVLLGAQDSFVDPPSIVLGGSTSKLASTISSKLKFPPKACNGDDNLLTKIKNKTAVLKIQSIKSVISKVGVENVGRKGDEAERQTLVRPRITPSVVPSHRLSKPGMKPVISKPKTPPPPPPIRPKSVPEPIIEIDPKKKALLQESPANDLMSRQREEKAGNTEADDDVLDDLGEFHVDLNIVSKDDNLPKTGFDFLDNW